MAAETVDTLELVISASASKAAENVRALATSVTDFGKGISSYIDNMVDLANVLERIADAAKGVASIKGIRDVIGKAARAASTARAATVGKAFEPIVPPLRPSGTAKGGTKLVNIKGTGAFRYSNSADEIARETNRQYGGSSMTNKALSAKIQEIRQMVMNGDEQAMKELTELAGEIARSAGAKRNISPMIAALNGEFARNYIGVTEKDVRGTHMSVGAMNALARSLGGQFRFKPFDGNRNSYGMRGIDEMDAELLRSVGVDTPSVEDLIFAMQQQDMHGGVGHRLVLDENYAHDNQELQAQIFDQLIDKIYAGEPVDIEAPAKAAAQAMAAAKQAAEEAARIVKEESEAWKSQASWNREQDARYKEEYGGKEKKWQMEAAWREHDRMNAPEDDFTAQEIAAWKAEMIKEEATIGPTQDMQSFVDDMTGVSRETKSAQESARVFISEMEYAGQKTEMAGKMAERLRGIMQESAQAAEKVAAAEEATRAAVEGTVKAKAEIGNLFEGYSDEAAEAGRKAYEAALARQIQSGLSAEEYAAKYPYSTPEASGRSAAINYGLIHDQEAKSYFAQIAEDAKAAEEAQRAIAEAASQDPLGDSARVGAGQTAEEFMESVNAADLLQMKLEGVGEKLEKELGRVDQDPAKIARLADQYQKLSDQIKECGEAAEEAGEETKQTVSVLGGLKKTMKDSFIGKNFAQFFRTAKARLFRETIKALSAALKEGISNLYQWSKASNGHFAGAMDTMATKFMLIKNSVATAVAPLIESFIPVIVRVANWVNTACNALAQFFALLTGQKSWTKATESAQEWAAATGTGAGNTHQAAKEAKDLLADWDELNIIQQEANDNGGGSGGGSGKKIPNYSEMFEEISVFDKWTEHFEAIRDIVYAIGAGIAAWFLVDAIQDFTKNLGFAFDDTFSKIKRVTVGVTMMIVGFELGKDAGKSFANNGITVEGLLEELGGMAVGGAGGALAFSALGWNPVAGLLIGIGITLVGTYIGYEEAKTQNARDYIAERLQNEVFHFDVDAVADEVNITISNADNARKSTRKALEAVLTDLSVLKLGVDEGESWEQIYHDVMDPGGLLEKTRQSLEADEAVVTMYYTLKQKTTPTDGKEGGEGTSGNSLIDSEAFKMDMTLIGELEGWYEDLGKKFASSFKKGQNGELELTDPETAEATLKQMLEAEQAAQRGLDKYHMEVDMANALKGTDPATVMREMENVMLSQTAKTADMFRSADRSYVETMIPVLEQLKVKNPKDERIGELQQRIDEAKARLAADKYAEEAIKQYGGDFAGFVKQFVNQFFPELKNLQASDFKAGESPFDQLESWVPGIMDLIKDFDLKLDDFLPDNIIAGYFKHFLEESGGDTENARKMLEGLVSDKLLDELVGGYLGDAGEELKAKAAEEATKAAESAAAAETAEAEARKAAEDAVLAARDKTREREDRLSGADYKPVAEELFDAMKLGLPTESKLWEDLEFLVPKDNPLWDRLNELVTEFEKYKGLEDLPDWIFTGVKPENALPGAAGGDTSWFTGTPTEPVKVNATESGMAMDSTVTNLSNVNGEGFTTLEGIMKTLGRAMEDVAGNTKALVGKNWSVTISPSSGLGDVVRRGAALYSAVTGE